MDRKLYFICKQYVSCCDCIESLISVVGLKDCERIKLFELLVNRLSNLEKELETVLTEKDLEDMMVNKNE